jgi:hypothetical protein
MTGAARTGARAVTLAALLGWAALAPVAPGAARAAATVGDPGCGTLAVGLRPGALVYRLPRTFLRPGSDSVWSALGPLRRGADYLIDPVRGDLRLLREPAAGETLWVSACWLLTPPPLEARRLRYRPPAPAAAESSAAAEAPAAGTRPATSRSPFAAPAGAALTLTGNKTLAVDFGSSQDAFLRQSLDLAVSGTLAPGVTLTGVLSDRNTPLTAAGTTQDLQALDRVLIELQAPRGSATLGDITLDLAGGEFARLERRLQGAQGTWNAGAFQAVGAAASAQGEYRRLELIGVEGRQGPYSLTDRDGVAGVAVVAGSEVVTLDGERLTRGESADYSMDYERGRLTFTNRRLITANSRITVDYQFAVTRYRRNLAAAGGRWERGPAWMFARLMEESDDRGRPLDLTLDAADRAALALAGDSASRAVAPGVFPGPGDYDTVRVDASTVVYAFAGTDSGAFQVSFARVGAGLGDYADSSVVGGRTVYRWVGPGAGAFRVGRALPLPESHRLAALGGGMRWGIATLDLEGALSMLDRNTFSSLDGGDDVGRAGRAALTLAGAVRGPLPGEASLTLRARGVGREFAPFARLERPFAQEDWGVPLAADLERQDRVEAAARYAARGGHTVRADVGRLRTLDGFEALRRSAEWTRDGAVSLGALWQRSDAERQGWRFRDGGRERWRGEARWRLPWVEPGLRVEEDERRAPSDTGRVGERFRERAFELQSGRATAWRSRVGLVLRRDARAGGAGFVDQSRSRTWSGLLESPPGGRLGVAIAYQRREVDPLADPRRTRGDLGSLRVRGEEPSRGLRGNLGLEVTAEGENRRIRQVVFVGPGQGAYDAFGNFTGTGDYNLVVVVSPELDRVSRAATSALAAWEMAGPEALRGSRLEFAFEAEARRRGALRGSDLAVSPGATLADPGLARASVLQRLEGELAPSSRAAAVRLRLERRVTGDRSFEGFSQTVDDRQGSARWRARPGASVVTEVEARLRRQSAEQRIGSGAAFQRTLEERAGVGTMVYTPGASLRLALTGEASWSRPEGAEEATRTLRAGPDLGFAIGARGRAQLGGRRAFVTGPAPLGLLPSAEPAGAPRWEGNARLDYRVRESTTFAVSVAARERIGRAAQVTGRAELRAFF